MPDLKISQLPAATTPLAGTELVPIVQSGTTDKVTVADLTAGRAVSASALTASSGNLTFSGTAQRITGDMSNATQANRLAFQSSTVNGNTALHVLPNGTSTIGSYLAFNNSDPTNAAFIQIQANGSTEARLVSSVTGTGTYLPMTFYTFGSEKLRIAADATGTYTFGGTAPRITGDFSNATQANRLAFQTSTTNGVTTVYALPNGTATFSAYRVFNNADPTNAAFLELGANGSTEARLVSSFNGTGTYLPMTFLTGGSERMRIDTSGNVGIGTASPGALFDVGGGGLRVASTGAITSVDLADAVGYKGTPINEQSAAYGLQLTDQGKTIVHPITDNNARTFTIPANGSIAFPVGTTITFINMINTLTIAITTDTMYLAGAGTTGSRTLAAYGMATAVKITSTSWIISGNGLT